MSAATNHLVKELASWAIALGMVGVSIVHFDEIRGMTRTVLGIPEPSEYAQRSQQPDRETTTVSSGGGVELRADSRGHYSTDAYINGSSIGVLVDTGATMVALTYEDAENAGIFLSDSDFTGRSRTANGVARIAPVTIDEISIGNITIRNVRGAVAEPGRLFKTLLGMSFLGQLERFEVRSGVLIMED